MFRKDNNTLSGWTVKNDGARSKCAASRLKRTASESLGHVMMRSRANFENGRTGEWLGVTRGAHGHGAHIGSGTRRDENWRLGGRGPVGLFDERRRRSRRSPSAPPRGRCQDKTRPAARRPSARGRASPRARLPMAGDQAPRGICYERAFAHTAHPLLYIVHA